MYAFFPLEAPLLRCPERFQIHDGRSYLAGRERPCECRHGQPLRLVERVPPAFLDHLVQHGIGMFPGMSLRAVRWWRHFALRIRLLPSGAALAVIAMTRSTMLLVDEMACFDPSLIGRWDARFSGMTQHRQDE